MGNMFAPCDGGQHAMGSSRIAIVGLDGAGKTSLCLQLAGMDDKPRPTGIEDCLSTNKMSSMRLNEWQIRTTSGRFMHIIDLGGKGQHQPTWAKRYVNVLCMLVVIDAANVARWPEFIATYEKYIQGHLLSARIPAVFVLNKTDLLKKGGASVTPEMVKEGLGLEVPLTAPDQYEICQCSVVDNEGLDDALDAALSLLRECKMRFAAAGMLT